MTDQPLAPQATDTPWRDRPQDTLLLDARVRNALLGVEVVCAAVFLVDVTGQGWQNAQRAWQIYLVNYLFWSGLAVAGIVWPAIWRITRAGWGRRLTGAALPMFGFAPVALAAFLPLIAGREHLFLWTQGTAAHRAVWLNATFVFARNGLSLALLYAACAVYAYLLLRPALGTAWEDYATPGGMRAWLVRNWRSAEEERAHADGVLSWLTPALFILYALVLSLTAFDLVMSLDPHFVSTLFGAYYFMTNLYAGLALLAVLMAAWFAREPRLAERISRDDLHALGKMLFGFCMLFGMLFWSQYLVIWYGNLLEEIPFVILRQNEQPWQPLSYAMFFAVLLAPFSILLSAAVKKDPRTLAAVSMLILAGMWLERYVLVVPSLWHGAGAGAGHGALAPLAGVAHAAVPLSGTTPGASSPSLPLGFVELAVTLGFAAAFVLCYAAFARAFPVTLFLDDKAPAGHSSREH